MISKGSWVPEVYKNNAKNLALPWQEKFDFKHKFQNRSSIVKIMVYHLKNKKNKACSHGRLVPFQNITSQNTFLILFYFLFNE